MDSRESSDDSAASQAVTSKVIESGYAASRLSLVSPIRLLDLVQDPTFNYIPQIAGFFADVVEGTSNARFHDNLSILQKAGIFPISKESELKHRQNTAMLKGIAAALAGIGLYATIYGLDYYNQKRYFESIIEAITGGLAYIVGFYSPIVQGSIRKIYRENSLAFNEDVSSNLFKRFQGAKLNQLPNPKVTDRETLKDIYIVTLIAADLHDNQVVVRAQDLGQLYGFASNEIDDLILSCQQGTQVESGLSGIVSISLDRLFSDMAMSVAYAKKCAQYVVENDPYTEIRERRRNIINQGISASGELSALGAGMFELLQTPSLSIIRKILNPDFDQYKTIVKRFSSLKP